MLGEDRVVVFDMPGTTRDSIYINFERQGKPYTLIDTAGIRRRKNINLMVENSPLLKPCKLLMMPMWWYCCWTPPKGWWIKTCI